MFNASISGYIASNRTSEGKGDSSQPVTNVRVMHTIYKGGKEKTVGVDVAIWGSRAQYAAERGIKGNFMSASGRIVTCEPATDSSGNLIKDKEGNYVMRIELNADEFEIVNRGSADEGSSSPSSYRSSSKAHPAATKHLSSGADDPF